jgi:hypothetical protein
MVASLKEQERNRARAFRLRPPPVGPGATPMCRPTHRSRCSTPTMSTISSERNRTLQTLGDTWESLARKLCGT